MDVKNVSTPKGSLLRRDKRGHIAVLCAVFLSVAGLSLYQGWWSYRDTTGAAEITARNYTTIIAERLDATLRRTEAVLRDIVSGVPDSALNAASIPFSAVAWRANSICSRHSFLNYRVSGLQWPTATCCT